MMFRRNVGETLACARHLLVRVIGVRSGNRGSPGATDLQ